ncbi:MAG: HNH endonuclease, partial [Deltaproteobacteria bacterium]|nr:HNH endonuclease [Deltaproteobacteria bacterium]
ADHIKSFYNGGSCDLDNFFPACPRCNNWKRSLSVEGFRLEISKQTERLRLRVPGFRLAEDFGMIEASSRDFVFWFELLEDAKCQK